MKRRNFLKSLAALLPTSVITAAAKGATAPAETVPVVPHTPAHVRHAALGIERNVSCVDCSFFCDVPADKGCVVELADYIPDHCSGQYPVVRPGKHSGQPIGVLLDDVADIDFTRICAYGNITPTGGKVAIVVGRFDEPIGAGERLYYDKNGKMTTDPTNNTRIGTAMSSSDEDGFIKMRIDLHVNQDAKLPSPN